MTQDITADSGNFESANNNAAQEDILVPAESSQGSSADTTEEKDDFVIAPRGWYILKVQVNREDSVKNRLEERIRLSHLEEYVDDILVPTETVVEHRNSKRKEIKRKLYPGYLIINMEINKKTWFVVRETAGVGDFTGANGKPVPMRDHEVKKILQIEKAGTEEAPKINFNFGVSDRVKIKEGTFEGVEGEVIKIDEMSGRVTVMITIFARSTPMELEYWQVAKIG